MPREADTPRVLSKEKSWIGVDLDRTLARYEKWGHVLNIGDPIWPMVERVKQWLREGQRVKIFTARVSPPYEPDTVTREDIVHAIQDWTELWIGQRLEVTNIKDPYMVELWDDRAVQVEPNTGEPTTYWTSCVD